MPLTSKHRAELSAHHPDALTSSVSGTAADVYLINEGRAPLAFAQDEVIATCAELLADYSVMHMNYADNANEQERVEEELLGALRAAIERRRAHPSFHFPAEPLEQRLRVRVHGLSLDLETLARLAVPATDQDDLKRRLRAQITHANTLDASGAARQLVSAAHLALNWTDRHGSLHHALHAALPGLAPDAEVSFPQGTPTLDALTRSAAHDLRDFGGSDEMAAHTGLITLALQTLLLASHLDGGVFTQDVAALQQ